MIPTSRRFIAPAFPPVARNIRIVRPTLKARFAARFFLALSPLLVVTPAFGQGPYVPPDAYDDAQAVPVAYRQNLGQVVDTDGNPRADVHYVSEGAFPRVYLREKSTVSLVVGVSDTLPATQDTLYRIDLYPIGDVAMNVDPQRVDTLPGHANYYYAHTGAGVTGVTATSRVVYEDIYQHIDWHFYGGSRGGKMAFVLRPGCAPSHLKLGISGADSLHIDLAGHLKIFLAGRWLDLREAIAYQVDSVGAVLPLAWDADYVQIGAQHAITFAFDTYDQDLPLILLIGEEPPAGGGGGGQNGNLDWSTLLGGSTTNVGTARNFIHGADTDPDGNLYVAGHTRDGTFPATTGQTAFNGQWDIFTSRFRYAPGDPTLDARLDWSTFVGGTADDKARGLSFNKGTGKVHVVGWTTSTDLHIEPDADPMDGSFWENVNKGGMDGVILTLDTADGYVDRSIYFGGEGDDVLLGVADGRNGDYYITGTTSTANGASGTGCTSPASGFPVCDPGGSTYFQSNNAGLRDALVARFDSAGYLIWSTFYGKPATNEAAMDIDHALNAVPSSDRLVIGGSGAADVMGPPGSFQLTNLSSAFVATFLGDGTPYWATQVKMGAIQTVHAVGRTCTVAGLAFGGAPGVGALTCLPNADSASICDPGGGAYIQSIHGGGSDDYIADFDLVAGVMKYGTFHGGTSYEDNLGTMYWPQTYDPQPFNLYKTMDLAGDEDGVVFLQGNTGKIAPGIADYPTLIHPDMYDQAYLTNMGHNSADVTITGWKLDRSRFWCTVLGGNAPSVSPSWDNSMASFYSEMGTCLAYAPYKALYVNGTSGSSVFPTQCPYPGVSWCDDFPHVMDAFMSRFNMFNVWIGVPELAPSPAGLSVYPVPASDRLTVVPPQGVQRPVQVRIVDALGRAVWIAALPMDNTLSVDRLAPGCYVVTLVGRTGLPVGSARFIKN